MKGVNALILVCGFCLCATAVCGQTIKTSHGAFYFLNGFLFFHPTHLNQETSAAGYPVLKSTFGSGFGGYGVHKGWVYGGEGMYLQRARSNDTKTTSSFGGLGYFYLGKNILNTARWKIFPAIGVGLGGVTHSLVSKVNNGADLVDIITIQPNSATLEIGTLLGHTALSLEYKFFVNYFVGLKGGYNFSLLGPTGWSAPGLDDSMTVKDSFGGLFLTLQVGFTLD